MRLCIGVAVVLLAVAVLLGAESADKPKKAKPKDHIHGCPKEKKTEEKKCPEGDCDDLCKSMKNVNTKNSCYGDMFLVKVQEGKLNKVMNLLRQNVTSPPSHLIRHTVKPDTGGRLTGYTALMLAAQKNNTEMVEHLLTSGSPVNHQSVTGDSALYLLSRNGNFKCVKMLLEGGAKPDLKTKPDHTRTRPSGYTSLMIAAWNRFSDIVKTLLDHHADPNVTATNTNYSALYLAARNGDLDIVQNLTVAGAYVDQVTSWGVTPLLVATYWGYQGVVEHLLDRGADPNITERDGYTMLHKAVYYNYPGIVDLGLKNGADVNIQSDNGYTALIQAVRSGRLSMIQKVVEANPNPNLQENTGKTALHWAARLHGPAVVQIVLKTCPNSTIEDNDGRTPLDIARRKNTPEVVKILEAFEANPNC